MATYVNNLRLTELATGEGSGTWGTTTNTSLELIGEALGYNTQDCFTTDANATTTVADGATDPARAFYFKVTSSATLTATRTLTIAPNTISRVMFIENATTGSQSIEISQGSGANVTIATGRTAVVYLDGAGSTATVVNAMANVDPGITDTLAEVLAAGNTSGGTNIQLTTTDEVQFRDTALKISSSADGQLDIDADTELEVTAPTVDINASTAVLISNDLKLDSDSAVLGFGADNDVTLTHIADTALRLNASRALQFRDSAISISSSTDGQLDIDADNEVEITTTTLDLNGALDVSGDITTRADVTFNGDLYNVIWDKSDSSFEFGDQAKAKFGTGADFEIFFNGTVQRFQAVEDVSIEMRNFNTVTSTDVKDVVTLVTNSAGSGGAGFRSGLAIRHTDDDDKKVRILAEQANDFSNAMGMILQTSENNTTQPSDVVKLHSNGDVGFFEDTGTTELFFWDASAEKLGIGTASPSQPIHVVSSGFTTGRFSSTNTVSRITFDNSGQTNESYTSVGADGSDLQFRTNNAERMRVDSSGNVGIGVSSPGSLLDVNGTITADGLNVDGSSSGDITVTGATNGNTGFFSRDPTATTYGAFFGYDDANTTVHIGGVTDGTKNGAITIGRDNSLVSFAAGGDVQFYEDTGTSIKMKWDASAESLGIGVGAPQASLHIANDASRTQFIASGTVGNDRFVAIDVDISGLNDVAYITVDQADSLAFGEKTNDNDRTIANEHMRIDASGNVGISTSSPAALLHAQRNGTAVSSLDSATVATFQSTGASGSSTRVNILAGSTGSTGQAIVSFGDADDPDIGRIIYRNGDNSMALITNDSEAIRINSSGGVGVGTSSVLSANSKLHVQGNGITTADNATDNTLKNSRYMGISYANQEATMMYLAASDASTNALIIGGGTSLGEPATAIAFRTGTAGTKASGTEAMRITSDGRVGIGTNSPGAELEVASSLPELRLTDTDGTNHHGTVYQTGGLLVMRSRFGTSNGAIKFEGDSGSTQTEFGRFTSSGNFLVGKTATGTTNIGTQISGDGYAAIVCTSTNIPFYLENKATGGNCRISFTNDSHGQASLGLNNGGDFTIFDTTAAQTRFSITQGRIITATGGIAGIDLGGSGASNRLDDYEEGTFTPELADASSGGNTGTATTLEGRYTKVGRQIVVVIKIEDVDTTGMTGANNIFIRGLPFTAGSGTTGQSQGSLRLDRVDLNANCCGIVSSTTSNSTYLTLRQTVDNSADVQIKVQDFTSGSSDIFITITYFE